MVTRLGTRVPVQSALTSYPIPNTNLAFHWEGLTATTTPTDYGGIYGTLVNKTGGTNFSNANAGYEDFDGMQLGCRNMCNYSPVGGTFNVTRNNYAMGFVYRITNSYTYQNSTFFGELTNQIYLFHLTDGRFQLGVGGTAYYTTGTYTEANGWVSVLVNANSTETALYINGAKVITAPADSATAVNITALLNYHTSPDLYGLKGDVRVIAIWNAGFSGTTINAAASKYLEYIRGFDDTLTRVVTGRTKRVILESNSLGWNVLLGNAFNTWWVNMVYDAAFNDSTWAFLNHSQGVDTYTAMMTSIQNETIKKRDPRYAKDIVVLWEGGNDIQYITQDGNKSAANAETICRMLKAAGFKVVIATCLPRSSPSWFEAERLKHNTYIVNNWRNFADSIVDIGAHPTLGVQANTLNGTYYLDGVHPTATQNITVIAPLFKAGVLAV